MDLFVDAAPPADLRVQYGPEALQFGELRLPVEEGPHPVVIVIHGGFWRARYDLEHIGHLAAALSSEGCATWSIEYRRIGDEGGGWPGTFQDVGEAAKYLRELAPRHSLDLERVIAIGHSAGGHLALWLGGCGRVPQESALHVGEPLPLKGVVALAAVSDLNRAWELRLSNSVVEEFLGGAPEDVPERYATASPAELLPLGVRQMLVHGTEDEDVPFEISARYHNAALEAGDDSTLVTLPGSGHMELVEPWSKEYQSVLSAVRALLGSPVDDNLNL
jgi:acetyl esterase/lipase